MTDQTNKEKGELLLKAGAEIAPAPAVTYKHPDTELDIAMQDKIFHLFCVERKSGATVASELGIPRELVTNLIRTKKLNRMRDQIILSERKEIIKNARHKIATGFSDNITVASEIAGYYKRKMMRTKESTGDIGEFIRTMTDKDFALIRQTMDVLHKYVHTGLTAEMAKEDLTSDSSSGATVVEFSEGYKPELLEDSRFKAIDIIKSLEARSVIEEEDPEFIEEVDTDSIKDMEIHVETDPPDKL